MGSRRAVWCSAEQDLALAEPLATSELSSKLGLPAAIVTTALSADLSGSPREKGVWPSVAPTEEVFLEYKCPALA